MTSIINQLANSVTIMIIPVKIFLRVGQASNSSVIEWIVKCIQLLFKTPPL